MAIDHQLVGVQVKPGTNAIPKKGVMGLFLAFRYSHHNRMSLQSYR
jgi:hypothetical protein